MPGGGVRSSNIGQLATATKAVEYHSSGLISKSSDWLADQNEIELMVQTLNNL
jgi:copper homeostasis protein CutC